MRRVRRSRTAATVCEGCLPGAAEFGFRVIAGKQQILDRVIDTYLAENPQCGFRDPRRKFHHFPVSCPPFTVVYDTTKRSLRVLFIVHQRADRRRLNSSAVEW